MLRTGFSGLQLWTRSVLHGYSREMGYGDVQLVLCGLCVCEGGVWAPCRHACKDGAQNYMLDY
jgi:hypothetical protein